MYELLMQLYYHFRLATHQETKNEIQLKKLSIASPSFID